MLRVTSLLFLMFAGTESSRVLLNAMHASDSHIGSMLPLATSFAKNGHYVHFLESNSKPHSYKYPPNISHTYIQLRDDPIFAKNILPKMWTTFYGPTEFAKVWKTGDNALVEMYQDHKEQLSKVTNSSWDLVVADELFAVASYGLSLKAKKKGDVCIVLATCVSTHLMRWHMAYGAPPTHRPSMYHPVGVVFDPSNFVSRFHAAYQALWIGIGVNHATTYNAVKGLSFLGIRNFHLSQLAHSTSYYFVDDLNSLVWPYPIASDHIPVGYYCPALGSLPEDYRQFLEDPTSKGTILIAFGSNVLWKHATKEIMTSFVEGINNLTDYRIVFAFNGDDEQVKDIGPHCKVTRWAPQKEVLFHKNTKLFISHGGMKSVKDTICGKVPVIYMPLFAEQSHNAELARQAGFAEILLKTELNTAKFLDTIKMVLENAKYRKAVERFNALYLDQPMPSLELGAFYANRAMKRKDRFPVFKIQGMFINTFIYVQGEVAVLFIALFVLMTM